MLTINSIQSSSIKLPKRPFKKLFYISSPLFTLIVFCLFVCLYRHLRRPPLRGYGYPRKRKSGATCDVTGHKVIASTRDIGYLWCAICTSRKLTPFFSLFFSLSPSTNWLPWLRTGSLVWGVEDELLHSIKTNFTSDEIYLGYRAAIPGKLSDHLSSWPPQRQPWCSQKTFIQK